MKILSLVYMKFIHFVTFLSFFHWKIVVNSSVPEFSAHLSTLDGPCQSGSSVEYSDYCSFQCDTGYILEGASSATCLESGGLSSSLPTCTSSYLYRELRTYETLQLYNYNNHKLQTSHWWSTSRQSFATLVFFFLSLFPCLLLSLLSVVTCSLPAFSSALSSSDTDCVAESQIDYSTVCTFQCDTGYDLVGDTSVTCEASGQLSTSLPTCQSKSTLYKASTHSGVK